MGIWNLSAQYDYRYKKMPPGTVAYTSTGDGTASNSSTTNYVSWTHTLLSTDTLVVASAGVYDTSTGGPTESLMSATLDGKPMTPIGLGAGRVVVFYALNSTAGTKTIKMTVPTAANMWWAPNSVAFSNSDGISPTVVVNPAVPASGRAQNYGAQTATITSLNNSVSVFCVGAQTNSTITPTGVSGGTQRYWNSTTYAAGGIFTTAGTGSSQTFSCNVTGNGSVVAFSVLWTP